MCYTKKKNLKFCNTDWKIFLEARLHKNFLEQQLGFFFLIMRCDRSVIKKIILAVRVAEKTLRAILAGAEKKFSEIKKWATTVLWNFFFWGTEFFLAIRMQEKKTDYFFLLARKKNLQSVIVRSRAGHAPTIKMTR